MDLRTVAILLGAALAASLWLWLLSVRALLRRLREARSRLQSQATRHGQVQEQFAPFLADWPWDPKQFRFIGSPVDGVQFTESGVVFVEVKTQGGRLTPAQQAVRDHVEAGRVRWQEVRIR